MSDGIYLPYSIMNPTGNITALVEADVETALQPVIADRIMQRHPEVEQVGFVTFSAPPGGIQVSLRMAGGEFCGNASMSAAALYLLRMAARETGTSSRTDTLYPSPHDSCDTGDSSPSMQTGREGIWETVRLSVSGASHPVDVRLMQTAADCFRAGVRMPPAEDMDERLFTFAGITDRIPLVRMEGISHVLIGQDSAFFGLRNNPPAAEKAVREWCDLLSVDGLGLLFLESDASRNRLTPLVYIPASRTVFWENSCGSGTTAAGIWLAQKSGQKTDLEFEEPGGQLRVVCDPGGREAWLYGKVRLEAGDFIEAAV